MSTGMPKNWKKVQLGNYLRESKERNGHLKAIPVLSVTNTQGFVLSEEYFDKQVYSKNLKNYKIIRRGQFAYNPSRLNVGSLARLNKSDVGLLSPMYVVFETLPGLDGNFLSFWLTSNNVKKLINANTQGTVRDSVVYSALSAFPISLPPIHEQQKIAVIIGCMDKAIERSQIVIEQIRRIKKAISQELLTKGIPGQHKTFKKSYLGKIPQQWDVANLGDLTLESRYGTSKKANTCAQGHPVLRIPNILSGELDFTDMKYVVLPDEEVQRLVVKEGDILLVRTNGNPDYVGRCAIINDLKVPTVYASYLIRLRLNTQKIEPHFLSEYLRTEHGRSELSNGIRTSAGNYNLNTQGITNVSVPIPPIAEQKKILKILKSFQRRIKAESKRLDGLKIVKTTLMEKFLTSGLPTSKRRSNDG